MIKIVDQLGRYGYNLIVSIIDGRPSLLSHLRLPLITCGILISETFEETTVNFNKINTRVLFVSVCLLAFAASSLAQGRQSSTVVYGEARAPMAVATGNNLYCAGYIQKNAISTANTIIGANDEADGYNFSQGNFLYINVGSSKGANVGDVYSVVRPRGQVESRWTKKPDVGFYVQEVGAVEVVRVKQDVSVVRVKASCDTFYLGDVLQLSEQRVSPLVENRPALDIFADPSGKAMGRILMARDGTELLSRDFVVYVDLGADDSVKVGDKLTIFRPLGRGNLMKSPEKESVSARDEGYQSDVYRGGKMSNQAGRKSGDKAQSEVVTTYDAKAGRMALRKIVGEAVVLNVKEHTATVVITRTAQEIHTGDWVEIQ